MLRVLQQRKPSVLGDRSIFTFSRKIARRTDGLQKYLSSQFMPFNTLDGALFLDVTNAKEGAIAIVFSVTFENVFILQKFHTRLHKNLSNTINVLRVVVRHFPIQLAFSLTAGTYSPFGTEE